MRLDRYLVMLGLGSRKEVQGLIRAGAVTLGERQVRDPGADVKTPQAALQVDGQRVLQNISAISSLV